MPSAKRIQSDVRAEGYPRLQFEAAVGFSVVKSELLKLIAGFWLSQALHMIDHCETLNDHKFSNLSFGLQCKPISFTR